VSAAVTQAVLLVGGEGRRLRPLTDTRPKPMMSLVDRPFVTHQLDHLSRHGIHDVIFSCGYRPEALELHFGDGSAFGMRLSYVVDPEPLGTAGAVKNAEGLLTGDRVLVFNGDILTDLDLDALAAQHVERGSVGTIALTPVEEPWAYGLVRLHPDRSVEAFLEKPSPEELRPGEPFLINAGTYLLERQVVERMPAGRKCSIEREVFPEEAGRGGLYGFPSECYWRDIGTPASYRQAHLDVLAGSVRTESPTGLRYLGPGAQVADGATVGPLASLGAGAVLEEGANVERSVIGDGARIGRGAHVTDAIVGAGATIGEGSLLSDGVVIGDRASIGAGNRLRGPLKVATGGTIPPGTLID
jgi:mannose-1-phosphate guanylyltransferase